MPRWRAVVAATNGRRADQGTYQRLLDRNTREAESQAACSRDHTRQEYERDLALAKERCVRETPPKAPGGACPSLERVAREFERDSRDHALVI